MSALAAVLRGRQRAEALMLDVCTVQPVTGHTTNPDATVTPTYGAAVYSGRCKLQTQKAAYPSTPDAGEHQFTVLPLELHLPVAAVVAVGQLVTVTESVDPVNVGRRFRIRSSDRKTMQTALRCQVEEVPA